MRAFILFVVLIWFTASSIVTEAANVTIWFNVDNLGCTFINSNVSYTAWAKFAQHGQCVQVTPITVPILHGNSNAYNVSTYYKLICKRGEPSRYTFSTFKTPDCSLGNPNILTPNDDGWLYQAPDGECSTKPLSANANYTASVRVDCEGEFDALTSAASAQSHVSLYLFFVCLVYSIIRLL